MEDMKQPLNTKKSHKKRLLWLLVIITPLVVGAVAYAYHQATKPKPAKTTSTAKTAQNNYHDGDNRPNDVGTGGTSQGGAIDNKGEAPSSPSGGGATITSDSGVITVKGIAANSLLSNGDALYGTSTSQGVVNFRVIDEEVGMVAQGTLQIVNGSFSGKLAFTPHANTGRLDVYTTNSMGEEENNLEIPVRFK